MPPKRNPAADLAAKMLQALQARRDPAAPFLTLQQLGQLADPQAGPDLILQTSARAPMSKAVVIAVKKNLAAPVALPEDAGRLAESPALLLFLLRQVCTDKTPTVTIAALVKKVATPLRKPLEQAVRRQVEEGRLPGEVEWLEGKKHKGLHPRWLALPKDPEVELAERLVRVLEAQRRLGPDSYPLRLGRLAELAAPEARPTLLKKALAAEPFKGRAAALLKSHTDPPVALAEDLTQAADHPLLLESLLDALRTPSAQAFTVAELKTKLVAAVQKPFADALGRRIETQALPPGVGWIGHKKNKLLFRLADVQGNHAPAKATPPAAPPADFDAAFDEAFARLDRQAGSFNFVSLVELRRALPLDRDTFDAQLRRLRQAGRYSLSAAEGRHGIRPEERDAAVSEEGTLLLFVSRKTPPTPSAP